MRSMIRSVLVMMTLGIVGPSGPAQASEIKYSYAYLASYQPIGDHDNAFYSDELFADYSIDTFGGLLSLRPDYAVSSIKGVLRQNAPRFIDPYVALNIYSTMPLDECYDDVNFLIGRLIGATCYSPFLNFGFTRNYYSIDEINSFTLPVRATDIGYGYENLKGGLPALGVVGVDVPFVPLEPVPVPASAMALILALVMLSGVALLQRRPALAFALAN